MFAYISLGNASCIITNCKCEATTSIDAVIQADLSQGDVTLQTDSYWDCKYNIHMQSLLSSMLYVIMNATGSVAADLG